MTSEPSPRQHMDRRSRFLFVFVVAAFALLAFRTESNDHHIERVQRTSDTRFVQFLNASYDDCLAGNGRITDYNRAQDELARLALVNPRDVTVARARAAAYQASKRPLADCDLLKPYLKRP